jgi:hypothetical protein
VKREQKKKRRLWVNKGWGLSDDANHIQPFLDKRWFDDGINALKSAAVSKRSVSSQHMAPTYKTRWRCGRFIQYSKRTRLVKGAICHTGVCRSCRNNNVSGFKEEPGLTVNLKPLTMMHDGFLTNTTLPHNKTALITMPVSAG